MRCSSIITLQLHGHSRLDIRKTCCDVILNVHSIFRCTNNLSTSHRLGSDIPTKLDEPTSSPTAIPAHHHNHQESPPCDVSPAF